ncbi:MAG: hypothetical protein JJ896_14930 [Rhodothermales bacterium]|nr:hypothetical protein [Rhodothermales bacterium]MBO6780946.1 hypothetical protein [Rhodothermales bacterium]
MRLTSILLLLVLAASPAIAQEMTSDVPATSAEERAESVEKRKSMAMSSVVGGVPFRNVGPTIMSGRVTDIDAWVEDPTHFFVAYASGGLWRTDNNGVSFEPVFDNQGVMTIGDIAVDWTDYPNREPVIWVGTGENNSSRSSYAGDGVYRSDDGGGTWQHMGLAATQRTGRILIHPEDPNTVFVGAVGPLYSPSPDRGLYKTTDGGQTWRNTLSVDEHTGVIDLVQHPSDANVMYAATWHRERRAWNFVEGGEGSGIWRTDDAGETWTLLSTPESGFPQGDLVGRIGLAVYGDNPDIMYALLDNYDRRPAEDEEEEEEGLTRDALRNMSSRDFLLLDREQVADYLQAERFPRQYSADRVIQMVRDGEIEPVALVEFVEDANSLLFNTPVIAAEVYRSDDGGQTWSRTHEDYLNGLYNSYGYYFGEIRVAPDTPDRLYVLGVPLLKSEDGGASWTSIGGPGVHADHQAMWVNPRRVGHIINGNDGGLNMTWDDGENWAKLNTPSVGQFYAIQVDDAEPYNVYGGLQDNGVWYGPSNYQANTGWVGAGRYPYRRLAGGDGMQVEVDTRTNDIVYTGSQFGFYSRVPTGDNSSRAGIRPRHELGERPLRFNWQTPIHLSRHNQDILYYGSNRLHRSMLQGEEMEAISPDLTLGGRRGDVPYGTLATIDESPLRFGLLYTGSDDGLVHVSRDGGVSWQRISDDMPQNLWVSRVEASHHEVGRVYVTLNGYRWDHFDAYVYASDDFGATWRRIDAGLPDEPVNVIVEDPENEDILYVGTDHGAYASLDRGVTWHLFMEGLHGSPVHDLKVQQREKDLVVGTHGRSIYIGSIQEVQQLTGDLMARNAHVFDMDDVGHSPFWGRDFGYGRTNEPSVKLPFWIGRDGLVTIRVMHEDALVFEGTLPMWRGLNYIDYGLTAQDVDALPGEPEEAGDGNTYLTPGTYTVQIDVDGETASGELKITSPRGGRGAGEPQPRPEGIK